MEYDRLTKREESGAVTYDNGNGYYHTIYSGNDGHAVHALAWKLAELEDKIEQGALIELPFWDKDILEDYAHRIFDSWNDITGAIHNGCSWYSEVLSVIDDIVGMVYGITKREAEKRLKELQNG